MGCDDVNGSGWWSASWNAELNIRRTETTYNDGPCKSQTNAFLYRDTLTQETI